MYRKLNCFLQCLKNTFIKYIKNNFPKLTLPIGDDDPTFNFKSIY